MLLLYKMILKRMIYTFDLQFANQLEYLVDFKQKILVRHAMELKKEKQDVQK